MEGERPARLAIFATHPIQYHAPWFRALNNSPDIQLEVAFCVIPNPEQQGIGFDTAFSWDVPLLEGYKWRVLPAGRRPPRLDEFWACSAHGFSQALRAMRPDVVLLTGWNQVCLLRALLASRLSRVPVLVRGESNALRKRTLGVRLLHRLLLRQFAGALAIGSANRAFYVTNGVPPERIFDCPYFVDNDFFVRESQQLEPRRQELRRTWSVKDSSLCVAFVGKLVAKKRPRDLILACHLAHQKGFALNLLMVGSGEEEAACRQLAADLALPVTFTGFLNQSEVPRAYVAADVLVLPSDHGETWGLVANEAMACARPVIVSDRVGCGPDLVRVNETGFTFPFGSAPALSEILLGLSPEKAAELGRNARHLVLTRFAAHHAQVGTQTAVRAARRRQG